MAPRAKRSLMVPGPARKPFTPLQLNQFRGGCRRDASAFGDLAHAEPVAPSPASLEHHGAAPNEGALIALAHFGRGLSMNTKAPGAGM